MALQLDGAAAVLVGETTAQTYYTGGPFTLGPGPLTKLSFSANDNDTDFDSFGSKHSESVGPNAQTGSLLNTEGQTVISGKVSLFNVLTLTDPATGASVQVGRVEMFENTGHGPAGPQVANIYILGGPIDPAVTYTVSAIDYAPGSGPGYTYSSFSGGGVVCFAEGTLILAEGGPLPVEAIRPGMRVQTADNGLGEVIWHGRRAVRRTEMVADPSLLPVLVAPGPLGNDRPLLVSRQHRLLLGTRFIPANLMVDLKGGRARVAKGKKQVTYHHLLLERHEVLFAEGAGAESLYLGPASCDILGPGLLRLQGTADAGPLARPTLRRADLADLSLT